MDIPLDEVIYFDAITTTPSTGAAVDADSTPTFAVYEEATDTDIGVGGNLTKRTSLTGNYRGTVTLSAANGFEVGKWYSVIGSAVVGGVTGKAVLKNFRVVAAEAIAGKPKADVDAWLGTAAATPTVAGVPEVDVTHYAGDTTDVSTIPASVAAILVDTGTDIPAAIAGIGTAGGAAINVDATTDNAAGGISGVTSGTTKVGTETGTFANASFVNGTYHLITHSGNAIDWVYQFLTGGGTSVVNAIWTGYLDGANDTITFYAWNHVGGAWESIGTQAGQAGTTNVVKTLTLYSRHRGTSAAELGKVYLRLACTGMTSPELRTDALSVSYSVTSRSVGYANGAVWIDTSTGVAGTESFVNGVADNPVLTLADALTIATASNLRKFEIGNGSTITLAASTTNKVFEGHEWNLELGGQSISDSMFIDANVSGIGTGTNAEFETCSVATSTLGPSFFWECSFSSTLTLGATGAYFFYNCHSAVAGTGAPVFDLGALGTQLVQFRRWSGGMTINNIASGDVISIDVVSGGTITLNGADGTVQVRGMCNIVDNRTGSPTLGTTNNMDARFDSVDTMLTTIAGYTDDIGVAGAGLTALGDAIGSVNTTVNSILVDTNELQTDLANGGRLDLLIDAILEDTDSLDTTKITTARAAVLTDWIDGGRLDVILDARASQSSVDTANSYLTTNVGLLGANLTAADDAVISAIAALNNITAASVWAAGTRTLTAGTNIQLPSTGLDLILVDTKTLPAALQIIAAGVLGKVSGAGTSTEVFVGLDGTTTRATVTADASGNRTAVTYA